MDNFIIRSGRYKGPNTLSAVVTWHTNCTGGKHLTPSLKALGTEYI